jgi:hypothetical protein
VDDCLEVEGLGEEVGEGEGLDLVTAGDEGAQVAGEGCGVAGDVDERRCGDADEQGGNVWAEADAGRVDDDQIGLAAFGIAAEKVEGCGADGGA